MRSALSTQKTKEKTIREQQVDAIRWCFRSQPCGGWDKRDVHVYLESLGIEPKATDELTDQEIERIYQDLINVRML